MGNFKELRVWQDSINLAQSIYEPTRLPAFSRDFGLCNQIQRAAVSIGSNIAEGNEMDSLKQSVHFLYIAKGSVSEVITQLHIANRIGYIDTETLISHEDNCEKIRASLKNLIKVRSSNPLNQFTKLLFPIFKPF